VKSSWATIGKIGAAVVVGICLLAASGCGGEDEIWAANAPSPDGRWLATASTVETSGFGTGDIETVVSLEWTKGSRWGSKSSQDILVFAHNGESTSKTIHLSMNWVAPTHLDVIYDGSATVELQVVKYGDVDISLRDLSKVPNTALQQLPDWGIRIAPSSGKSGSR
jgi:hypothetical protein